jgi:hypothetical protein
MPCQLWVYIVYVILQCTVQQKNTQEHCALKEETENVPPLLEDNYSIRTCILSNFSKNLFVSVCNSLLSDMFNLIQASWFMAVESVLKKFP